VVVFPDPTPPASALKLQCAIFRCELLESVRQCLGLQLANKDKAKLAIAVLESGETILENRAAFVTSTDIERSILIGSVVICHLQGFGSSSV